MNHTQLFYKGIVHALASIALLLTSSAAYAQTAAPVLGTVGTYGAFSGTGAITNTGLTVVNGDIGTYAGAFTGFPPGIYTGAKHVADPEALVAKNDLTLAYNSLNDATHAVQYDTAIGATMGNGQVLTSRTYGRGDLTTIAGTLTFDAQGDPSAVFIVKIGGALDVAGATKIALANGAQAANIYWAVDGAVSILDNSSFKGTILANGAIHLYGGSMLEGRALAVVGAVTLASNIVTVPGALMPTNNLVVITPATGDSIAAKTQNYQITWGGTGIAAKKTIEYSLDGGATWMLIDTVTTEAFAFSWDVPDTVSNLARVRVTDMNGLSGTSGIFTITRRSTVEDGTLDSVILSGLDPANNIGNAMLLGIRWTYTGDIGTHVSVEYSFDGMQTWSAIATIPTATSPNTQWMTPANGSYPQVFIRVTSSKGMTVFSIPFSISTVASISDEMKAGYELSNHPNPASASTTIRFVLPVASDVGVTVVDGLGRVVGTIDPRSYDAGGNDISFDSSELPAGVYSYVVKAGAVTLVGRMSIVH